MKTPTGLQARGRAFWRDVTDAFDLPIEGLRLLEHASRTLDELGRMQEALADVPLTVPGSAGQEKPHPLFAEVRAHRALLAKLLRQLDLPELPDEHGQAEISARSERAKKAADMRWANVRAIREGVG
jgi:hypothetical protein